MSTQIDFSFSEDDLLKEIRSVVVDKLEAVGRHLQDACVRNISTAANDAQKHSAPGEFPYKQSEELLKSVDYEVDLGDADFPAVVVGTDVKYGKMLEYGTSNADGTVKMLPRRWLGRTLDEETTTINGILES